MYGAAKQYTQLQQLMQKQTFVHIVAGPPGTMKSTMLRKAAGEAGLAVNEIDVDSPSSEQLEKWSGSLGA